MHETDVEKLARLEAENEVLRDEVTKYRILFASIGRAMLSASGLPLDLPVEVEQDLPELLVDVAAAERRLDAASG